MTEIKTFINNYYMIIIIIVISYGLVSYLS